MPKARSTKPKATSPTDPLDNACNAVIQARGRPLLVLYYPYRSRMTEDDLNDVYLAFRREQCTPDQKLPELDVLIESYGGDPVAGYRLAQLIRDFAENVHFLVPSHAYSAATILCFAGNEIRLGHFAGLSPIDITLTDSSDESPITEVELASIEKFLEFSVKAREQVEKLLRSMGSARTSRIDSDLLVAMVKEIGALNIGKFYRERNLTGVYADELLSRYMFQTTLDKRDRTRRVVRFFLNESPSHQFHMDLHLCKNVGLLVEGMNTSESDLTKTVVATLSQLVIQDDICPRIAGSGRLPFFRFYTN